MEVGYAFGDGQTNAGTFIIVGFLFLETQKTIVPFR
jgi:hypothetical protein